MSKNTTIENKETYLIPGGLPIEEARKLSNKLKEAIEVMNDTFEEYKFYGEVESSGERQKISSGVSEKEMLNIPTLVESIALTSALQAFLEDAIKAYEHLKQDLNNLSFEAYCGLKGIPFPILQILHDPVLTEEDFYGNLSVEETCRLLTLQARAATIGQLIHPHGHLNAERQKVIECSINPMTVSGTGKDTLITKTTPGIGIDVIDSMFYHLQDLHRDAQKRVNTFKFNCQKAIDESVINEQKEFQQKWEEDSKLNEEVIKEYNEYIRAEQARIRNLGVAIPKMLKLIYQRWVGE